MTTPVRKAAAACPQCATTIRFSNDPELGQLVTCPECEEEFEVVELHPLTLDWLYDEEFEYGDFDDEELDDYDYDDEDDEEDEYGEFDDYDE